MLCANVRLLTRLRALLCQILLAIHKSCVVPRRAVRPPPPPPPLEFLQPFRVGSTRSVLLPAGQPALLLQDRVGGVMHMWWLAHSPGRGCHAASH